MSNNPKQRLTLINLAEPQQMRELNRQLTWIWDQLLGGLSMKSLNKGTQEIINSKAESEAVDALGKAVERNSTQIIQAAEQIALKAEKSTVDALGETVESHSSAITQTADAIGAEVRRAVGAEEELASRFEQTAEGIRIEVSKKANAGDPAPGVDTGDDSSVQVQITSDRFNVNVPGEDGDFELNETGGRLPVLIADRVTADNLTYRYEGPAALYVDPAATSDQLAGGAYFRGLTDACASLNDRTITRDVTISVLGDSYGDAVLTNICGGSVTIQGGGRSLIGTMNMKDCTSRIGIYGLAVTQPASSAALSAVWIANCRYVAMEESVRISGNGGNNALVVEAGSTVWMLGTELYNAKDLIYAVYGTHVTAQGLKGGGCVNFAVANGCILKMEGGRPEGGFASANAALLVPADPMTLPVNGQSAQPGIPEVQTAAWDYIGSDSYAGGWNWIADDDVRQGFSGSGRIYGVIWFDAAAIRSALNGRTINQASLRLYMLGGVGRGVPVGVQLYGTNMAYDGHSGAPEIRPEWNYGTIGTASPGMVNEITIPVKAAEDIVSGATQALVLLSDDEELYKDRGYSRNYARFAGSTTASAESCPRLTVVYQ